MLRNQVIQFFNTNFQLKFHTLKALVSIHHNITVIPFLNEPVGKLYFPAGIIGDPSFESSKERHAMQYILISPLRVKSIFNLLHSKLISRIHLPQKMLV